MVKRGLRKVDRSFRVGGDEFAILLPQADAEAAKVVVRRLLATALQPALRTHIDPGSLSFSAGISALPSSATGRAELYSQADAALYAAKRAGRTEVVVFDRAVTPTADPNGLGAAVAEVVARAWLRPVYQPIMELRTGVMLGVEGLDPADLAGPVRRPRQPVRCGRRPAATCSPWSWPAWRRSWPAPPG